MTSVAAARLQADPNGGLLCLGLTLGLVVTAAWALSTDSASAGQLLKLSIILAGLVAMLLSLAAARQVPRGAVVSAVAVGTPTLWYLTNVLLEGGGPVFWQHVGNLLDGVLPGLVIGAILGAAVRRSVASGPDALAHRRNRRLGLLLLVDGAFVAGLAVYLARNTLDNVLLVSVELLAGAENYQAIGDAMTINLIAGIVLADAHWRSGDRLAPGARSARAGVFLLAMGTLLCAVLTGSNKLLVVALGAILVLGAGLLRQAWRRRPLLTALGVALGLLLSVVALAWLGGLAEVLALTRLLDYGQVDSILETPSLASRSEIASTCGSLQFAYAPMLGDLRVEHVTCGAGNYLHSLVSVQTHLGIVGSLFFLLALSRGAWLVFAEPALRPLKLAMALILGVGLIAAFFAWMPFWFLMGIFLTAYPPNGSASAVRVDQMSVSPATLKRTP